uniref:Uncharacterized protein n=1 Tax=Papio anubis TaxID=9555 RepID=A0A8I5R1I2_PAPAN
MSFGPHQAGETTHPSSGMLARSYEVIGVVTPRLAVLTSQALWRIFQKYQSRLFFFCIPVPTIPREWTRVRNGGRKEQQWRRKRISLRSLTWPTKALPVVMVIRMPGLCATSSNRALMFVSANHMPRTWAYMVARSERHGRPHHWHVDSTGLQPQEGGFHPQLATHH